MDEISKGKFKLGAKCQAVSWFPNFLMFISALSVQLLLPSQWHQCLLKRILTY